MARANGPSIDLAAARQVVRQLERELSRSSSAVRKGATRAMRKTLRSGKSAASKEIRDVINLKKKAVDQRISTWQTSQRQITGTLTVRDRRVELAEFMTPADRERQYRKQQVRHGKNGRALKRSQGVSVKVWKKKPKQLFAGTFLNIGHTDRKWHVLKRVTEERYPIHIQYGPSITKEFEQSLPAFAKRANQVLQRNLEHELAFALGNL